MVGNGKARLREKEANKGAFSVNGMPLRLIISIAG